MKDLFNKMTDMALDVKDAMMENFDNLFNMEKMVDKFTEMSDGAKEKYAKYNSDLISLSPIIEEIGFKTKQITLSMGIPPSFTFHFEKTKDISPERREEIMEQHKENKLLRPIVKMIVTADNYQNKIALGSFKFNCIEISLGLTPGVTLQLLPKS
jgi:hypothetical protein